MTEQFETLSYRLCTSEPATRLIEVYPHTALIRFLDAPYRLEYKATKAGRYWPTLTLGERQAKLHTIWARIVEALERRISGVAELLPSPPLDMRGWGLKAFEDRLDAVVCCAVGIACLDGKAKAYGDEDAAIWVPAGG